MRDLECTFQSGFPVPWGNKHQPAFLRFNGLSAPLAQLSGGRSHSVPKVLPQPLAGRVGRPWAPLPLQCDHMVSLCSLHSRSLESTFFLFVFLMVVVVIVSKVSPPLLLPWPPCPGSVSSSVTKAALDLGSLGREVAGSGSCSRCLFMVLLQPLPRWAHKWALSSKQNHPPPRPQRHVDPASPWEGGGDRRRRKRSKRAPLSRLTSLPHFPQPRFQSLTSYPPAAP